MKFKIKKWDNEILERLQDKGIMLSRDKALILVAEFMLDKIVREVNEFISLWRELFPNCRLQDFEVSEEKKKILSRQKRAENGNSKTTIIQQEMQTEAGIEYWDLITLEPKRKPVKAEYQLISDLWKNGRIVYLSGKTITSNYKQQNMQQLLPGHVKHYQFPKQLKSYTYDRIRLPSLYKNFGKPAKSTRNLSPFTKMPQLYQRQTGSKPIELGTGSYKSLESYLTDYKDVVKNEI
jgi:hypothetical protein